MKGEGEESFLGSSMIQLAVKGKVEAGAKQCYNMEHSGTLCVYVCLGS